MTQLPDYIPQGFIPDYVLKYLEQEVSSGSSEPQGLMLRPDFNFKSQGFCSFSTPYKKGEEIVILPITMFGGYSYTNKATDYVPYSEILTNIRDMNSDGLSKEEIDRVRNCVQSYEPSESWKKYNDQIQDSIKASFAEDPEWLMMKDSRGSFVPPYHSAEFFSVSQHRDRYFEVQKLAQYAADKIRYHYGLDDSAPVHVLPLNDGKVPFLDPSIGGFFAGDYSGAPEGGFIAVNYTPDSLTGIKYTTLVEEVKHSIDLAYSKASPEELSRINAKIIERNGFDPDYAPSLEEHAGMIGINAGVYASFMSVNLGLLGSFDLPLPSDAYSRQYIEDNAKEYAHRANNPLFKF